MPDCLLENWCVEVETPSTSLILPDGCQDLICRQYADGQVVWFITNLAETVHIVHSQRGERFCGYRFHPAYLFDPEKLLGYFSQEGYPQDDKALACLDELLHKDESLAEILPALTVQQALSKVCASLGVSERTLQRVVCQKTHRSPSFWKGLARVRKAALLLKKVKALTEVALQAGYSDQPHMTREFRRWFQATPAQFVRSPAWYKALQSPAFPACVSTTRL